MRPIITAVAIVVVLLLVVIGYAAAGFAFASSRLSAADHTLNTVITNENAITGKFNSTFVYALNTSATVAEFQSNKTQMSQLVTQTQAAQTAIAADDASLATAQAGLMDNSWLTVFSRSSLDQKSSKIGHWRNALATAKTINTDLVQLGTFVQAYDDSLIDVDAVVTKGTANDFTGMAAALGSLKTDVAKAISLSGAPGLPADMKAFLTDVQTEAVDTEKLLNDAVNGADDSVFQADVNKIDADGTKVDAHDIGAINTAITAFYAPLIDAYNAEVSKANSM